MSLAELAALVDESLLGHTEETHQGMNRAKLIQGDASLEKDPEFNQTIRYTGGIGFSVGGLPQEILEKSKIITLSVDKNSSDWAVFKSTKAVVLAASRNRRLYLKNEEGARQLACGSNHIGRGAQGWNGDTCVNCPFYPKNVPDAQADRCKASIDVLTYFPELDHSAIFTAKGTSYMAGDEWLKQISVLSKKIAETPDYKKLGIQRVNSFFFVTTLSASGFHVSDKGEKFNQLEFSKANPPYKWDELLASSEHIKKAKEILASMEQNWAEMYQVNRPALLAPSQAPAMPAGVSKMTVAALPAAPHEEPGKMTITTVAVEDDDDMKAPF